MDRGSENRNLNLIVAAYVKMTQLGNMLEDTRNDWDYSIVLLKNLHDSGVVKLADEDLRNMMLAKAELKRVSTITKGLLYKYDPDVYVNQVLKAHFDNSKVE